MATVLSYSVQLFVFYIYFCNAYKILLLFPLPTRSHQILGEGYVRHLTRAGHEITYLTPFIMKNPPLGVRQIYLSENKKIMNANEHTEAKNGCCRPWINVMDNFDVACKEETISVVSDPDIISAVDIIKLQQADLQNIEQMLKNNIFFVNSTFCDDKVKKLLRDTTEKFDAVIAEWLYVEVYSGLAAVFDCPLIWASSLEPHSMVLSLIDEYLNPAYTVHHLSQYYGFNFWQRAHQLWTMANVWWIKWRMQTKETKLYIDIFEDPVNLRGRLLPAYEDVKYNSSLVLGNSYISTGDPISLPQNYKYVGGYHIKKEVEPLPKEIQKIMDEAKYGVIYFSLGSVLRSSQIPEQLKNDILNVFRALNQTVIWKFEEALPSLPKNVHILSWTPQISILAHPNCVLFITHGGILSKHEALHFGVPMIGIPYFLDQFMNINIAENKGFGKRVDLYQNGAKNLDLAIKEILQNSSYRERAKEYSFIHHHRPVPPETELVHWVEHVIKTRGALHLRSPALRTPWYQKYYIDLTAAILLCSVIFYWLYKQGKDISKRYLKEKRL